MKLTIINYFDYFKRDQFTQYKNLERRGKFFHLFSHFTQLFFLLNFHNIMLWMVGPKSIICFHVFYNFSTWVNNKLIFFGNFNHLYSLFPIKRKKILLMMKFSFLPFYYFLDHFIFFIFILFIMLVDWPFPLKKFPHVYIFTPFNL